MENNSLCGCQKSGYFILLLVCRLQRLWLRSANYIDCCMIFWFFQTCSYMIIFSFIWTGKVTNPKSSWPGALGHLCLVFQNLQFVNSSSRGKINCGTDRESQITTVPSTKALCIPDFSSKFYFLLLFTCKSLVLYLICISMPKRSEHFPGFFHKRAVRMRWLILPDFHPAIWSWKLFTF